MNPAESKIVVSVENSARSRAEVVRAPFGKGCTRKATVVGLDLNALGL